MSVGAFIHGTTVTFPAVAIPSLIKSNNSDNITVNDAFMPFHLYEDDVSLIGEFENALSRGQGLIPL